MIRYIKWLIVGFFLLGILLGVITAYSFDDYANVSQASKLSSTELKRVKYFIQKNNPLKLRSGQTAHTKISQQDLNLVLNYLSRKAPDQFKNRINSNIILQLNQAYIQSSLRLPQNPLGSYINISAEIESVNSDESDYVLAFKSLSIGKFRLPTFIANPIAMMLHSKLKNNIAEYNLASQSLQKVDFVNEKLSIKYVWDKNTAEKIKTRLSSSVISDALKRAIIAQSNNLSKVSYNLGSHVNLNEVLRPMFKLAESRSLLTEPVVENKAVFIVLGSYALNKNISKLFDKKFQKPLNHKRLYIKNRFDLSKHILVSAAITSMADSSLAETIGLEKEFSDSQGGSGFSFADLAADHAGIKLAEYATKNEKQARAIQSKMATIKHEDDYMPTINNLPEGLTKIDFNKQYKNTAAYENMQKVINERIAGLTLYK